VKPAWPPPPPSPSATTTKWRKPTRERSNKPTKKETNKQVVAAYCQSAGDETKANEKEMERETKDNRHENMKRKCLSVWYASWNVFFLGINRSYSSFPPARSLSGSPLPSILASTRTVTFGGDEWKEIRNPISGGSCFITVPDLTLDNKKRTTCGRVCMFLILLQLIYIWFLVQLFPVYLSIYLFLSFLLSSNLSIGVFLLCQGKKLQKEQATKNKKSNDNNF